MSEKKKIRVMGTLEFPLVIGKSAVIREGQTIRITSRVQHYIVVPSGEVHIETLNTHYVLTPRPDEGRLSN